MCNRFACTHYVIQILKEDETAGQLISFFCDNVKLNSPLQMIIHTAVSTMNKAYSSAL
jgi:hypothetical protein